MRHRPGVATPARNRSSYIGGTYQACQTKGSGERTDLASHPSIDQPKSGNARQGFNDEVIHVRGPPHITISGNTATHQIDASQRRQKDSDGSHFQFRKNPNPRGEIISPQNNVRKGLAGDDFHYASSEASQSRSRLANSRVLGASRFRQRWKIQVANVAGQVSLLCFQRLEVDLGIFELSIERSNGVFQLCHFALCLPCYLFSLLSTLGASFDFTWINTFSEHK
jgi:hypothetical protein